MKILKRIVLIMVIAQVLIGGLSIAVQAQDEPVTLTWLILEFRQRHKSVPGNPP